MLGHISRTLRRPRDNHAAVMPARMPPRLNPRPPSSFAVRGGATRLPERAGAHRMLHHVSSRARPRFPRFSRRGGLMIGVRARPPGRAAGSRPTRRAVQRVRRPRRDHLARPSVVIELVGCTARDCAATFAPQVRTGGSGPNGAHDAAGRAADRGSREAGRARTRGAQRPGDNSPTLPLACGQPHSRSPGTAAIRNRESSASFPSAVLGWLSAAFPQLLARCSRSCRERLPRCRDVRRARRRDRDDLTGSGAGSGPPEGRELWRRSLRSPAPSG